MTGKVTCPGCGARLTYRGSPKGARNCPKCQTLISFDALLSNTPDQFTDASIDQPIDAEPVIEAKPQEAAIAHAPAKTPSKRSPLVLFLVGGLAAAMAGLMFLVVCCAGIAVIVFSGGDDPVALDTKAGPSTSAPYVPVTYDGKAGDYTTYSTPSYTTEPYPSTVYDSSVASSSSGTSTAAPAQPYDPFRTDSQPPQPTGFTLGDLLSFLGDDSGGYEEPAEEWGTVSEAQREAIRQQQSDYYRNQAEQAERWGNHDEASQFRHYAENP